MRKFWYVIVSLMLSVGLVAAQDDVCPTIVGDALTATDSFCSQIGRNEACYGNIQINAELADPELVFEEQGDIVNLTEIERLTLSPYVEESTGWGVALLKVQANIPDTVPGQNVTFLLFGDVDIANAGDAMEAFYFSSGVGEAACNEAESGIIINTPEGVGTVSLIANDVTIELGSTAVLTAQPDDLMTIALIEGAATVTANDVSQEFEGGFQVTVPINEDLEAVGPPSEPEPIPDDEMETLPDIMTFIPGEEGGEDDGSSDGDTVENTIVPQSGTWEFNVDTVTTSDACPPMMADAMTSTPIPSSTVEFDGEFSLETLMESVGDIGMDVTYGNPSPNVYTMQFSQEGVVLDWKMTLESETLMLGEYSVDMSAVGMACVLGVNYTVSLEE